MSKVLVSLEDDLLKRVDRVAGSRGMTRSAYLSELAESGLRRQGGQGTTGRAKRALKKLDRLMEAPTPGGDSTQMIRAERDAR
ncbi:MAG: hypothetical protein ACR2K6_05055 [Solirubrobacterales bacterium]